MRVIVNTDCARIARILKRMSSNSSSEDNDNSIANSPQRLDRRIYWTQEKRNIICNIFRREISSRSLPVSRDKLLIAIKELNESNGHKTEARIRTFVHSLRKRQFKETDSKTKETKTSTALKEKEGQKNEAKALNFVCKHRIKRNKKKGSQKTESTSGKPKLRRIVKRLNS